MPRRVGAWGLVALLWGCGQGATSDSCPGGGSEVAYNGRDDDRDPSTPDDDLDGDGLLLAEAVT
ncbi:MAG: hypothetical protein KC621_23495 [Myxococcales bacterium]|nr:hypothetical protein [Myxococcales bacterium]